MARSSPSAANSINYISAARDWHDCFNLHSTQTYVLETLTLNTANSKQQWTRKCYVDIVKRSRHSPVTAGTGPLLSLHLHTLMYFSCIDEEIHDNDTISWQITSVIQSLLWYWVANAYLQTSRVVCIWKLAAFSFAETNEQLSFHILWVVTKSLLRNIF